MLAEASTSRQFELPLSANEAIDLFMPEGERRWVPGWDPRYPDGRPSEDPGTVFVTRAGTSATTWIIIDIDRQAWRARYARLTPGQHAGTVTVRLAPLGTERCRVSVSYDVTLADDARPEQLTAYDPASFTNMMAEWSDLVLRSLER